MRNRVSFIAAMVLAAFALACVDDNKPNNPNNPTSPSPVDMAITIQGVRGNMSFAPATANVRVGQLVEWRNVDTIVHDLDEDNGRFDTGNIAAGTTSRTLRKDVEGTFPYHCTIHPGMVGTIVVTP